MSLLLMLAALVACESGPTDTNPPSSTLSVMVLRYADTTARLYPTVTAHLVVDEFPASAIPMSEATGRFISPAASPNAGYIAVVDQSKLFRIDVSNGQVLGLTPGGGFGANYSPGWSPDGSRIVFTSNRLSRARGNYSGLADVWVAHADGTNPVHVSAIMRDSLGFTVTVHGWTPGGDIIVETEGLGVETQVYALAADGASFSKLLAAGDRSAYFSPDGSKLAYVSERDGGRCIFMRILATRTDVKLSGTCDVQAFGPNLQSHWPRFSPWSPDGSQLAYYSGSSTPGVVAIAADGTNRTALAAGHTVLFLGWSPGGDRALIYNNASKQVSTVGSDGRFPRTLTSENEQDYGAVWLR